MSRPEAGTSLRHYIEGGASPSITEVEAFAKRWHEAERDEWNRKGYTAPGMDHDTYNPKSVKDRGKVWFAVDRGTSGHYLVRKADGQVFTIEGYGRPNYRYPQGHLSTLYPMEAALGRAALSVFREWARLPKGGAADA